MESQNIRAVARALDILEVIQKKGGEVGVTEVANELNLAKSTVHRILRTMSQRNFLRENKTLGTYALGDKIFELAFSTATHWDLVNLVMPYLDSLRSRFNETAAVAIKIGLSYVYIAEAVSYQEVRVNPVLGKQYPLHWAGTGKAILAFIPENERDEILKIAPTSRSTPSTITDPVVLMGQIEQIQQLGYAISFSERAAGAAVIASPICDKNKHAQGAVCLIGPEERLRKMDEKAAALALIKVGRKIEMIYRTVGYTNS